MIEISIFGCENRVVEEVCENRVVEDKSILCFKFLFIYISKSFNQFKKLNLFLTVNIIICYSLIVLYKFFNKI